MRRIIVFFIILVFGAHLDAQNAMAIDARVDPLTKTIYISQSITFTNTSNTSISEIYLNDWNQSYASKDTPLANRFAEEFNNTFHFAKKRERGFTVLESIVNNDDESLVFNRLENNVDIIKVQLQDKLEPNSSVSLKLQYDLVIPNKKFTSNGISDERDFHLKYWYITPSVFDGKWHYYSNKNLDDLFVPSSNIDLKITYPKNYTVVTELNRGVTTSVDNEQATVFSGTNRVQSEIIIAKVSDFEFVQTDDFTVVSNIKSEGLPKAEKALITDRITRFITSELGKYPHSKLMVSETEYKKDPLYGLNQLPSFLRPFPDNFQYEVKLLKTALKKHLENTLLVNPRKDYWLRDGLLIYYVMKYIEQFYPDTKLLGTLAKIWGVRSFHAADLKYNEQFNLFYMQMARTNRDQPLSTSKDSLIKFNANIANKYKAGVGLRYLDDFINANVLEETIASFIEKNTLKRTSSKAFEKLLKSKTNKDIDWFFKDYVNTRKKIDFKITDLEQSEDSVTFSIKNKREHSMPISLFKLSGDSILGKQWITDINGQKQITIAKDNANKLALNYDGIIPEFNLRDNYKSFKSSFFSKPFQFRLIKDVEDPYYNQIFLMPELQFKNIYDGLLLGAKFYNKTVLTKRFNYRFTPQYATRSKTITGGASVFYIQNVEEDKDLFRITYGIFGRYASFAEDAFVTRIVPSIRFAFRDKDNFRSNKRYELSARVTNIKRTIGDEAEIDILEPDYSVFNLRFVDSYIDLLKFETARYDLQFANDFGKASFNYRYRKLLNSNQQFNFRFFAGLFLYNNTDSDSDYFSFALDRPTDYLFDYGYLGRSEDSGIFSQQLILAEGGFKSQLEPAFANQWMTTTNFGVSIWRYIQAYGDLGFVKNKNQSAEFVYDSGLRLNLVQDYFEIYFPIYSNLGWEIGQDNYDQKIRFIFTADIDALTGLFRRRWF